MVVSTSPHLRPETEREPMELAFILSRGGLGDFIHWTTAIQYAIESNNHIRGLVATPAYFADLARHWFAPYYNRFKVYVYNEANLANDPVLTKMKRRFHSKFDSFTSVQHHLLTVGFGIYAQIDNPPKEWQRLPRIEHQAATRYVTGDYVVVTTEATSKVRTLPAETINKITEWLIAHDIKPVFLGKKNLTEHYKSGSSDMINTEGVVDLREKTELLSAAYILSQAKAVVGLDNGLLHLACCSDVPVAFAFTSVDPRHRIPPRSANAKTITITPPEDLKCRFCQSNVRFLEHDFRNCLYGDELCCKLMTAEPFIKALEELL